MVLCHTISALIVEARQVSHKAKLYAIIVAQSSLWYFNANKDLEIDNMACSPAEHGLIMALVCLLVQRHKGYSYKIKVYKGVL